MHSDLNVKIVNFEVIACCCHQSAAFHRDYSRLDGENGLISVVGESVEELSCVDLVQHQLDKYCPGSM